MRAIVRPERWDEVRAVCQRWDLPVAIIGRVTDDGDIAVSSGADEVARVPARALASEAVIFERESRAPTGLRLAPAPGMPAEAVDTLPGRGMDPGAVLLGLLGS